MNSWRSGPLAAAEFIVPGVEEPVGLSTGEIRGIVAFHDDGKAPCGHVLELLRSRADEVDETIRQLRALQADLDPLAERAATLDPADCDPERICTSSAARSRAGGPLSVRPRLLRLVTSDHGSEDAEMHQTAGAEHGHAALHDANAFTS